MRIRLALFSTLAVLLSNWDAFGQSRTVLNNPAVQTDINLAGHSLTNVGGTGGLAVTVDANGTVVNTLPTNYPAGHLLVNGVGVGTVQSLSVTTANGISGSFTSGNTPALTLALGAITPSAISINSSTTYSALHIHTSTSGTTDSDGFEVSQGALYSGIWDYENKPILFGVANALGMTLSPSGLAIVGPVTASNLSGTNTGDQDLSGLVPITRTVNGHALNANVTVTAADAGAVASNSAITGATKTKITYDAKGLVTSGTDATTADIADSTNRRYVTDAQRTVIQNTSGTNTGDQDLSGLVPITRTVNGHALSANVIVTAADAGAVASNSAITGATKTKITYDAKGLVTSGTDATTADIADSADKRYVTDAQRTVIQNTSGTNTGDQTITLTGDVTGSGPGSFAATIANDAVTYAKMQNVSATSRFLGRKTAGAGDPEELTASDAKTILAITESDVASLVSDLALKAPLASPAFTGTPAVPTAAVDTNTTQIASTAFVLGQAAAATPVVDGTGAAGTSTRYARADHVHPTDTSRAPLASPTFTGTPLAPTATANTNTTQIATTAFVLGQSGNKQTQTADGTTGTYTFTIPSGYTAIRIAVNGRSSATVDGIGLRVQFNSDTGSNYDTESVYWEGSTTGAAAATTGATYAVVGWIPGASATASYSGSVVTSIPGYANTAFYKTYTSQSSSRDGGLLYMDRLGGNWRNAAAITSVTIFLGSGNFASGSTFEVVTE
jgi:Repeat of unknown function (DUF5907)